MVVLAVPPWGAFQSHGATVGSGVTMSSELGIYIRKCRMAVSPAAVGLPVRPHRREPWLSRNELAVLADISLEYVIALEQGKKRRPTLDILERLADALLLNHDQRQYLFDLVPTAHRVFNPLSRPIRMNRAVRESVQALLERIGSTCSAAVMNRACEIVAYTSGYRDLVEPLGILDSSTIGLPNLARWCFTDPRARQAYRDWDLLANNLVAVIRNGPGSDDPDVRALVEELSAGSDREFRRRMEEPGLPAATGAMRILHPGVGEMHFFLEIYPIPPDADLLLFFYVPADVGSADAFDRLDSTALFGSQNAAGPVRSMGGTRCRRAPGVLRSSASILGAVVLMHRGDAGAPGREDFLAVVGEEMPVPRGDAPVTRVGAVGVRCDQASQERARVPMPRGRLGAGFVDVFQGQALLVR